MSSQHDITVLNSLIKTTLDSIKGFQEAAQENEAGRFESLFLQLASDRERVVGELQQAVRQLGDTPEDSSSVAGAAHRAFLNLKEMLSANDEKAIIDEVERGEDHIKSKFEAAAADAEATPETRAIVERCYQSVRQGHDTISGLKHSTV
ncbi:MAG: ferritin-like domain-containing protein [Sphingobium sp.]